MRFQKCLIGVLALANCLSAQITSRLTGAVVDPTGSAVPAAVVEVYLPGGTKPLLTAPATGDGLFAFTGVGAGTYDVVVSAPGFRKHTDRGVVLTAGEETPLAIKLEVGSATDSVEVTESATIVQTTNSEVASNMSRSQIKDLPILNRSPLSLVTALAGVSNGRAGDSVINGQRTSFTNMTLDGVNIQDNFIRTNAVDFSPNLLLLDQVSEMTISTSNTNPAFGNGASQVTFVTPSGTNRFHGGLFEQNRNSYFSANTWFNDQSGVKKPFLNLNQLGGKIGGPIKKDKLFFYANFEAYRQHQQSAADAHVADGGCRQRNLHLSERRRGAAESESLYADRPDAGPDDRGADQADSGAGLHQHDVGRRQHVPERPAQYRRLRVQHPQ